MSDDRGLLEEVDRAADTVNDVAKDKIIEKVDTVEDTIVFSGVDHQTFAKELTGRKVLDVKRHGKVFWLVLDGEGRMPVLHFGMTGMIHIQGQEPAYYQRKPKDDGNEEWPPKNTKFVLHIAGSDGAAPTKIAFRDPRRLGRVRLCAEPEKEPPVSELGFDPILSMPPLEEFSPLIKKRNMPIKALLLDQSFSAGVGNWVADEVLFHSRIHPEQRANTLSDDEIATLHEKIVYVCKTAVDLKADSEKFPDSWLFRHRWGKGKKGKGASLTLPDGRTATIKWITVGGRTSAIVEEVQKAGSGSRGNSRMKKKSAKKAEEEEEEADGDAAVESSELSEPPTDDDEAGGKRKRARKSSKAKAASSSKPTAKGRSSKRRRKDEDEDEDEDEESA
ncbi:hypothetical protein M407DRAFT_220647 [Tulasnella calospora MUT 4182]|uniref:Formamidopyrimidine-DNA glycosylase catalytic domain-containing protein n=1 Tax=Tulasnella calospora MUT 4182 TaxID=1051891 RepID=A0A0C3Q987_9AGAM|nr:hypothetical protein M407DRAFT_220647 [Tulasnella calospora MUT 4182]